MQDFPTVDQAMQQLDDFLHSQPPGTQRVYVGCETLGSEPVLELISQKWNSKVRGACICTHKSVSGALKIPRLQLCGPWLSYSNTILLRNYVESAPSPVVWCAVRSPAPVVCVPKGPTSASLTQHYQPRANICHPSPPHTPSPQRLCLLTLAHPARVLPDPNLTGSWPHASYP